jgi:hypothetical protein
LPVVLRELPLALPCKVANNSERNVELVSGAGEDVAQETSYIFMSQRARTGNMVKFK